MMKAIILYALLRARIINFYEVYEMKNGKRSIISTLVLACMYLLIFSENAYADLVNPPVVTAINLIVIITVILAVVIVASVIIINYIKNKSDNNKFN